MANFKFSNEFKVGIFVLVGLIILVFFVFFITDFKIIQPRYTIKMVFNFANGVRNNSPLRVAGVDSGEVKNVRILPIAENDNKTLVEITGWIRNGVVIPADSKVFINTLGLLGEKYIEIVPGVDYLHTLKDGEIIRGKDPIAMYDISNTLQEMGNDLKDGISSFKSISASLANGEGTLGKFLMDDSLYNNIDELILDLKLNPWKLFFKAKEKKPSVK
jgi:phospholipid/cholesterol/gamma-HCH transport system substrate-binding protein